MRRLVQAIADLGEARLGTGLVLIAAWRATDADAADDFVASLDGHPTSRRHHLGIESVGLNAPGVAIAAARIASN